MNLTLTETPRHLEMAFRTCLAIAPSSRCKRRKVGCVLAGEVGQILVAVTNDNVAYPTCERPDEKRNCGCMHAEIRAAIMLRERAAYAIVSCAPCAPCAKALVQAGIETVYFFEESEPGPEGFRVFQIAEVEYAQISARIRSELTQTHS